MKHTFYSALLVLFGLMTINNAYGQILPSMTNSDEQSIEEKPKDSYGRSTPRGTVQGYLDAMVAEDLNMAIKYFDFSYIPQPQRKKQSIETVQNFQKLLDTHGHFRATSLLSNATFGDTNDKIEPLIDNVGSYTWQGEDFPIFVEQATSKEALPIWLFSAETLKEIPSISDEGNKPLIEKYAPEILSQKKIAGVSLAHWALLIFLIPVSLLITWILGKMLLRVSKILSGKIWPDHPIKFIDVFSLPIFLFLSAYIFVEIARFSGISIIARQYISELPVLVAWLAFILFFWKLLNAFFEVSIRRLRQRHDAGKLSAMLFVKRATLLAFIAVGAITTLDMFGFDVTAGIAALGIGGIAIALGAQKTIENLVGSISIIFDQPVRVGDYCKIGDMTGTIEKIGMRSTRIRTLNRTVLTIPNGNFASQTIENYAFRDQFRYRHIFGVRYETSPDQIRYLLVEMRAVLYAHPRVSNDPARVRFVSLDDYKLSIEVVAYILAEDYSDFLEIQEDLHLRFMDIVYKSGSGFAFPSQTLYMAQDTSLSPEQTKMAEDKVKKWRDNEELQLPRFHSEQIKNLEGKIEYPPSGASIAKKDQE